MNREWKIFAALAALFAAIYALPLGDPKVQAGIMEAFRLLQWYARNHTLPCVIPALFIAGGIITFLSKSSVMRYLGPQSNKLLAYSVASVSGCVLAVCSCSVLPMFAGIYQLGAGLGPACAFLYSGPAINVLAIFLSARVLGLPLAAARAIGAVLFAFIIGLAMAFLFRRSEKAKAEAMLQSPPSDAPPRSGWKNAALLAAMLLFLIFSDWYNPGNVVVETMDGRRFQAVVINEMKDAIRFQLEQDLAGAKLGDKITIPKDQIARVRERESWVMSIYHIRWALAGFMAVLVVLMTWRWVDQGERAEWMRNTWEFAKLLVPLLYAGVFVVGFVSVFIPEKQVVQWVGDNSLASNFAASLIGAFWYFATLTEIPITQALMKLGMHPGPVLALLLAGPALSLPNILVIRSVMGAKKTAAFCALVVVMSTLAGIAFGFIYKAAA